MRFRVGELSRVGGKCPLYSPGSSLPRFMSSVLQEFVFVGMVDLSREFVAVESAGDVQKKTQGHSSIFLSPNSFDHSVIRYEVPRNFDVNKEASTDGLANSWATGTTVENPFRNRKIRILCIQTNLLEADICLLEV